MGDPFTTASNPISFNAICGYAVMRLCGYAGLTRLPSSLLCQEALGAPLTLNEHGPTLNVFWSR